MIKIKKILNIDNCPICYSKKYVKVDNLNSYELLKCLNCDLLYTKQKIEEIRAVINKNIYNSKYLDNYELRNDKLMLRFKKRILEIEMYVKGGVLLDYGCSTGVFLQSVEKFSKYKWKCTGIDINKNSIDIARKNNINALFINNDINNIPNKQNSYDVVTCFDVLEHDLNINQTLEKIESLLKSGGLLVVQSPNYNSIMAKLCQKNWDWWSVPDHVFHFTKTYLTNYLRAKGFKIIVSTTWEPKEDFVKNVQGSIKGRKNNIYRKIGAKLSYHLLLIFWYISKPFKTFFGMGALTLIIAQKV